MKKLIAASVLFIAAGAAVLPTAARADVDFGFSINIGSPPPEVIYEPVPPPRAGYAWVPGFWNWDGYQYVWLSGRWETARPGYWYLSPIWLRYSDGYRLERGGWYPNSYQRPPYYRPSHSYRYWDGEDHDSWNKRHFGWNNHNRNDNHWKDRNHNRGNSDHWKNRGNSHGHNLTAGPGRSRVENNNRIGKPAAAPDKRRDDRHGRDDHHRGRPDRPDKH